MNTRSCSVLFLCTGNSARSILAESILRHWAAAHWGVADPAAVDGSETERREAFRRTFRELENRIKIFVSLRTDKLDRLALQRELTAIGKTTALARQ